MSLKTAEINKEKQKSIKEETSEWQSGKREAWASESSHPFGVRASSVHGKILNTL